MRRTSRKEQGFTLLEIIVALAITAVGIAAAARYTASAATVAYETEQRMLAVWTAGNRLSELRIERAWPAPGGYSRQVDMGGRTWYLTETVSDTDQPNIRRVNIAVYTDPDRIDHEFDLYGYLARYLPPDELQGDGAGGPQQDDGTESLNDEEVPLPGDESLDVPPPGGEEQGLPAPGEEQTQESESATEPSDTVPQGQDQPQSQGGAG